MQTIYYCTINCLSLGISYIYNSKQGDTRPNIQMYSTMYIQMVQRSVEIETERQIAKDHNSLDTFKEKWSGLETFPALCRLKIKCQMLYLS